MPFIYLSVFVASVLFSFLLTRLVRNQALSRRWSTKTNSEHHIHTSPIPRLGGVAIFSAFLLVISILAVSSNWFSIAEIESQTRLLYILIPAALVFLLGLYDDLHSVRPPIKFLVQGIAATILHAGGFGIFQIPFAGFHVVSWLSLPLTVLWVIWITNAFNLIDGIDGLAAGAALFATLTVFVVSLVSANVLISVLTLGLAGAILGFLRFNFNPATIFLGDSGSLFIGFMLSALALAGAQKSTTIVAVAIPVVSFGLPILETVISVIRRFLSGRPVFGADRQHIHHKLLERGFSQRQAVIILYGVSAACGLLSLLLLSPSGPMVGIVLFVIGAGIWIGVQHLGYQEFFEIRRVAQRTLDQKRIIVNNLAFRRASDRLGKARNFPAICEILEQAFEENDFDGFRLQLTPQVAKAIKESTLDRESDYAYEWNRPARHLAGDFSKLPMFNVSLDLSKPGNRSLGTFSVQRICDDKALLVDINLITAEVRVALADALARASAAPTGELVEQPTLAAVS